MSVLEDDSSSSFERDARREGVDLAYEHAMQEQAFRESNDDTVRSPEAWAQAATAVSPRVMKDMDESLLYVDLEYEHDMQREHCIWIENGQGHFLRRTWLRVAEREVVLCNVGSREGLGVHTHVRNINDESYAHDRHPFVAAIHLLSNAQENSTVYISVPFVTDMHFLDELCHYAKPVVLGGRGLVVRVTVGPQRWVTNEFRRFVDGDFAGAAGNSNDREMAIGRLQLRRFGTDQDAKRSSYSHTTAMYTTAGALVGSYNFTYASKYRHREDGLMMPPGIEADSLRQRLEDVWNAGESFTVRGRHVRPPPGYVPPPEAKRTKTIGT